MFFETTEKSFYVRSFTALKSIINTRINIRWNGSTIIVEPAKQKSPSYRVRCKNKIYTCDEWGVEMLLSNEITAEVID